MPEIKVEYNTRVARAVSQQLSKDIVDSVEGSPELRAEMNKTLKVANERIRAITNEDLYSPAVSALNRQSIKGYSKFSIKEFGNSGESWEMAKQEYAKAVSFLEQPTSTITGTREWQSTVQHELGLNDYQFEYAVDSLMNKYNEVSNELVSTIQYEQMLQELYDVAMEEASDIMEEEAFEGAEELERGIEENAERISGDALDIIRENLENGFEI